MSQYAYLVCHDCKRVMWLGKTIFRDGRPARFHIGPASAPPNSSNETLTRALWKFLADHARHAIQVMIEGDAGFDDTGDYAEIGGREATSIPFDDYLKDWDG